MIVTLWGNGILGVGSSAPGSKARGISKLYRRYQAGYFTHIERINIFSSSLLDKAMQVYMKCYSNIKRVGLSISVGFCAVYFEINFVLMCKSSK
jgi:hypothetical protein